MAGWGVTPTMKPLFATNLSSTEQRGVFTNREQQVVALVCQGLSNKKIARELWLSEGTVKQHVHNILVKAGLRSRREIIVASRMSPREMVL